MKAIFFSIIHAFLVSSANAQSTSDFGKGDPVVKYENSVVMHEALKRAGVPARLMLYEQGKHGFGLGEAGMDSANWPDDFLNWMAELDFIEASSEFHTPAEDLAR